MASRKTTPIHESSADEMGPDGNEPARGCPIPREATDRGIRRAAEERRRQYAELLARKERAEAAIRALEAAMVKWRAADAMRNALPAIPTGL